MFDFLSFRELETQHRYIYLQRSGFYYEAWSFIMGIQKQDYFYIACQLSNYPLLNYLRGLID